MPKAEKAEKVDFHTTDYSKVREFNQGSGQSNKWLKMKPSETGQPKRYTIRLLPWGDHIFYSTDIHYIGGFGGKKTVTECPRVRNLKCPACDIFWAQYKNFDKESPEGTVLNRQLKPQTRIYANVLLRAIDKEEVDPTLQEPMVWSFTWRVSQMLKEEILNSLEEGIMLDHPTEGRDLVCKVVPQGASYKIDTISVKPVASAVENFQDLELHDLKAEAGQTQLGPDEIMAAIKETVQPNILEAITGGLDLPF